jgi:diguanylate cyclase (GGDEF)-like protein
MRKPDWRSGLLWVALFALTVAVMGWVTRQESDNAIGQNAEQSSIQWTRFLVTSVPDLESLFAKQGPTDATREHLLSLQRSSGVFRFILFDRSGREVLQSYELEPSASPRNDRQAGTDFIDPAARDRILRGNTRVSIHRTTMADEPEVIGEVDIAVIQQGKILGLARVSTDQTRRANDADEGLRRIVMVVSLLLALIGALAAHQHVKGRRSQRAAEDELRYLAQHDALSGALSRASLMNALDLASTGKDGEKPAFALLRIDLDRFKDINDGFGHAIGDEVLKATTQRLRACLGPKDQLARLEGDEFAILLNGPGSREAIKPIVQQIQRTLVEPLEISGHHVRCNASLGIALFTTTSQTADTLMNQAELALFQAKSGGRGTFAFHDSSRDDDIRTQRSLTRDLRAALAGRQLSIHYQPLFDTDSESLVGYEALLRWQHPTRGGIPPAVFVPLAEAAGLIDEIGLWVLRQACKDASDWPGSLSVAVNLSAHQFSSGRLLRQVTRALTESGLEPGQLCLEITESVLLDNSEQVMQTLRQLGGLGVSIAMDDFGTGFSSLAYLWRFPFDKIKIDQVFTKNMLHDPKVMMIVRSIVMLAHSLQIRINAEGVETAEQLAALQELGCHELQGFLLGRPAPADALTHQGHAEGAARIRPRGDARESLFATLAMELPEPQSGM